MHFRDQGSHLRFHGRKENGLPAFIRVIYIRINPCSNAFPASMHFRDKIFTLTWHSITSKSNTMAKSILENDFVICELDESLPVLRHRWKKETSGEDFRDNLMQILDEYRHLKSSYAKLAWLADTTLLGELDEDSQEWLVEDWEDLLFVDAGVKIHAVILGKNIFADYPMEQFKNDAEEKFKIFHVVLGVFSNERDAYRWIREQQFVFQQ
jgi:hypothetical protein